MIDLHTLWQHLKSRTYGWGEGSQALYDSPGHYLCERDRVCMKCKHSLIELMVSDRYIPCLDEMEPVDVIPEPKTLAEQGVEALERIDITLKHKDFSTDTSSVLREAKEHAVGLFRGCKRK